MSAITPEPPAIEVHDLHKRYGAIDALRGLDLAVPQGAFFGLLGPNGAGKTTLISVLATLTRPASGSARLLGRDVSQEPAAVRRDIGIVFQETALDPQLTAREHLDLHARLYHLEDRRRRVAEALARVGLEADAERPVRGFSGGMKRGLEIARGLLHRPRVLFLDEPTLGLDVAARASIWTHLRALHASGDLTIFLTTHSMEEADSLCERLAILDAGRRVAEGTPAELKRALGGDVVVLTLARADGAEASLREVEGVSRVHRATDSDGLTQLRVAVADGPRRLPALLDAARPFEVVEVTLQRPTLDHVFLHHTGHPFEPAARR
jgi:ABC-2 type transport system ATP-binding protein